MTSLLHALALAIGYLVLGSASIVALTIAVWVWREWLGKAWPRRTVVVTVERNGPFLNTHPKGHQTLHVNAKSPGVAWTAIGGRR